MPKAKIGVGEVKGAKRWGMTASASSSVGMNALVLALQVTRSRLFFSRRQASPWLVTVELSSGAGILPTMALNFRYTLPEVSRRVHRSPRLLNSTYSIKH